MSSPSDFDRDILQQLLAQVFAVQESRDAAISKTAISDQQSNSASPTPIFEFVEEVASLEKNEEHFFSDNGESFVPPPEFLMLPENEQSLYARCGAVFAAMLDLPGFRHSILLGTTLARRAQTLRLPSRPRNFTAPPVAPAPRQRARNRPPITWPRFSSSRVVAAISQQAKNIRWANPWSNFRSNFARATVRIRLAQRVRNVKWPSRCHAVARRMLTAEIAPRAKNLKWSRPWRDFDPKKTAAQFAERTRNFNWPKRRRTFLSEALVQQVKRRFAGTAVLAGFARRTTNLNKKALIQAGLRNSAPALVAVVLACTVLIAYRNHRVAQTLESAATPSSKSFEPRPTSAASTSLDRLSVLPKPLPGMPALTPASPQAKSASTALKRVPVGPNEVDYIGDDVTVRTFTQKHRVKHAQSASARVARIGDDVTVRYFSPQPAGTRTATR